MSNRYLTYRYPVPACNKEFENLTFGLNIGYIEGCLDFEVPFSAELFKSTEDSYYVGIFLPVIKAFEPRLMRGYSPEYCYYSYFLDAKEDEVVTLKYDKSAIYRGDCSFLKIGMKSFGYKADVVVLDKYLNYIEQCGLIDFVGKVRNGEICYLLDPNDNFVIYLRIRLKSEERVEAETRLMFRSVENTDVLIAFPGN